MMTVDQPYAIAKDRFLVIMGPLHIEMAVLKCIGKYTVFERNTIVA